MKSISFVKMQATGNDFIVIDVRDWSDSAPLSKISSQMGARYFGVGADQILFLKNSEVHDFRMVVYNADGSEGEMSGNGMRCFAKYLYDHALVQSPKMQIETLAGVIQPEILFSENWQTPARVSVDMGKPQYLKKVKLQHPEFKSCSRELFCEGKELAADEIALHLVSMGNPHAILFVNNVEACPLETWGPLVEHHKMFPNRTNFEVVAVGEGRFQQRTWERGASETLACGTGACAVAEALRHFQDQPLESYPIDLRGGRIQVDFDATSGHVFQTGEASFVFAGEFPWEEEL